MPPKGRQSAGKTGQHPEMALERDERAVLRIKPSLLHEAVNRAEQILVGAGPGPIFQRGGELVHVTHRPALRSDGSAEIQEAIASAGPAFFSRILAEHARCERYATRDKEWLPCDPPPKLAEQYYSLPEWKLPTLRQLISAPLIRRDGTLLHRQGYDPATGLYLTQELEGLQVPECPSAHDAETANEALTDLLKDFPWSDPPGRAGLSLAVAVAGVIAAVIRAILPTAPAFAVTAPARGNGKSYFVDLAAIIATGVRAACVATGGNLEELEKSLFAQLLEGRSVLNLDNMVQPLAGQLLCMVLTQSQVRSRVLGLSKMADASTGSTIFATGNNLAVKGDMVRRTLIATMDAGLEHPENRSFDRDLLAEVLARRAELVGAVLTLIRWRLQWRMDASQPLQSITDALPLAGYSEFCRLVRDPLMALGHPDPIRSIEQARDTDAEDGELEALIVAWHGCFQDKPKTCREAIDAASSGIYNGVNVGGLYDAIRAATHEKDAMSAAKLGVYLGRVSGRMCRGLRFVLHGKQRGNRCWKVV
jgi:putative DNA primase/helicase